MCIAWIQMELVNRKDARIPPRRASSHLSVGRSLVTFFFLLKTGVKICHVLPGEGLKLQAEDQNPARLTSQPGSDFIPRVPWPRNTCLASWSMSMEDHTLMGSMSTSVSHLPRLTLPI